MEDYITAGKIAADALQLGKKFLVPGTSIVKILESVEQYILSKDALLAFPAQISLNSIAAHQCDTDPQKKLQTTDLVKIDVGVCVNGCIADNAITVSLDGKYNSLIAASDKALQEAIKLIKPGVTLQDIGTTIENEITSKGFKPVRNLTGHGLEHYTVHAEPQIPNIKNDNQRALKDGEVIAIEPFASTGTGIVQESGQATVFTINKIKPVRNTFTKKALMHIKRLKGLPFGLRWLSNVIGEAPARFAIRDLTQRDIITGHPPLKDTGKGMVSQSEHTIIVKPKSLIITEHVMRT